MQIRDLITSLLAFDQSMKIGVEIHGGDDADCQGIVGVEKFDAGHINIIPAREIKAKIVFE